MISLPSLVGDAAWNETATLLPTGHQLNQPELLFSKIEDETIQQQVDKLHASQPMTQPTNETPSNVISSNVISSNVIPSGAEGGAEGPAYEPMKAEIVFEEVTNGKVPKLDSEEGKPFDTFYSLGELVSCPIAFPCFRRYLRFS